MEKEEITITTNTERVCKTNLNRALRNGEIDIQKLLEVLELNMKTIADDLAFAVEEGDDEIAKKTITGAASKLWFAYLHAKGGK